MILKRRSIGLAVGERSVVAAQVVSAGSRGRFRLLRAAQFVFPEGVSWHTTSELGRQLSRFLREQGMSGAAVVGLPGRYVVAAREKVPPADSEAQMAILRLRAERAFSLEPDDMVCDCACAPPEGEPGHALVVCTTRDLLDAVTNTMRATRPNLRAVTCSAAALALATHPDARGLTALVTPDGLDLVSTENGKVSGLHHSPLPRGAPGSAGLVAAVRMGIAALAPQTDGGSRRLFLWDGTARDRSGLEAACASLGVELDGQPDLPVEGLSAAVSENDIPLGRLAPAAALAAAGLERDWLPVDFVHSGLAEPRRRRFSRWMAWGAFLLAVLLVGAGAVVADRRAQKRDVALLRAKCADIAPSVEAAKEVVESVSEARGWYDRRPSFLDCLVALTGAFPEDGSIWATSLAIRDGMRGVLSGKSVDESAVLALLDGLQRSGRFAGVKLMYMQETRAAGGERAFAIGFTHAGER